MRVNLINIVVIDTITIRLFLRLLSLNREFFYWNRQRWSQFRAIRISNAKSLQSDTGIDRNR
jgi:hypothetical protein